MYPVIARFYGRDDRPGADDRLLGIVPIMVREVLLFAYLSENAGPVWVTRVELQYSDARIQPIGMPGLPVLLHPMEVAQCSLLPTVVMEAASAARQSA